MEDFELYVSINNNMLDYISNIEISECAIGATRVDLKNTSPNRDQPTFIFF